MIRFLISNNMASGIFMILDDVAALMDDVAVASKIATRKTAGILQVSASPRRGTAVATGAAISLGNVRLWILGMEAA